MRLRPASRTWWLLLGLVSCATTSLRVQNEFVPSLFGDLPRGTDLAQDPTLGHRFVAAWAALEAGNLREARVELDDLIRETPGPLRHPIYVARGVVELTADRADAALPWFEFALASSPRYGPAHLGKAATLHLTGDDEGALLSLDQLAEISPGAPGAASLRARASDRLVGRSQEAAREAETRGDTKAALAALQVVRSLEPGNVEVQRRIGRLALAASDYPLAREAFRAVTAAYPDDADAWIGLGEANLKGGSAVAAREAYERAAELPGGLESARARVEALQVAEAAERELDPRVEQIAQGPTLDRASLAKLLRSRLPRIERVPARETPAVITDVGRSWARRDIQDLVALDIMEVYDNHTFRPDVAVNRAMLAQTLARVLRVYRAAGWLVEPRAGVPPAADIPPEHVHFQDVAEVLRYGVLGVVADGEFRPFDAASGVDAAAAITRLGELLR